MPRDPDTPLARAKAVAVRFLSARARTEAQVRARLEREGLSGVADETVVWLLGLGYLDDAAYARARARSLLAPGRLGPRLAEGRIAAAGVPAARAKEAVAEVLAEAGGEGTTTGEAALCRALAVRRVRVGDPAALDDPARRRVARFLLGRGFSPAVVARVMGVWSDE